MRIYIYLKTFARNKPVNSATQMIQILKITCVRKSLLKIMGHRCGKDERLCHIEDHYEQGSSSLRSKHEEGRHTDLEVVLL